MNETTGRPECPHCTYELLAFKLPDDNAWDGDFQFACFNDECPYYQRGWVWMKEKYDATASYRFRIDPGTSKASPLAVSSPNALKDRIIEAGISASVDAEGATEGSA